MARDQNRHGFPMPRTAFVLLLVTTVLSVLPHLDRVPGWMAVGFLGVLVWRIQVFRERWPFPSRSVRLLLVMIGFGGVILHHGTVFGPDAGVGLLITAYLFKQLEMVTRRDAFLVVILSYFVLATEFLFSRSLYTTLYVLFVLVLITATQIALNQTEPRIAVWRPLKVSLKLLGQSVPLMLALFFLFPRIGPIWQLKLNNDQNFVGLNDRMSPGDISNLSRSGALAFRVSFNGKVPPNRELYWRTVVFDRFDGRTWHAMDDDRMQPLDQRQLNLSKRHYDYEIYLEPTGQRWLMALAAARVDQVKAERTQALTILNSEPVDSTLAYHVVSYPDYQFQAENLSPNERARFLQLPAEGNPKTRAFAEQLYRNNGRDPSHFIGAILHWFNTEKFVYTLKPPLLGRDSVDEFLFSTRRGFCAHYAGAFVFMLRSVGIPARVVGGYQGGQPHPLGKYLMVYQYNAHAWTEAWLPGRGWVRVDPTGAVAPNRIELGPMDSTTDSSFLDFSPLSPDRLRNLPLLSRARMLVDYVDYLWFRNVVSYNQDAQNQLFRSLLGEVTPQRIAMLLGGVAGSILLVLAVGILLRHPPTRQLDRVDRLYLAFCQKLARRGLERNPGEGPQAFSARAGRVLPDKAPDIARISVLYQSLKYAPQQKDGNIEQQVDGRNGTLKNLEQELARRVRSFRP